MITDNSISYIKEDGLGHALAWIIDDECLYTLALNSTYADLFLLSDEIQDVSSEYLENGGITVRFYKNGEQVEDFNTTEYFGSILLSPHKVINLFGHEYGWYAGGSNTRFVDNRFVILDRNQEDLNSIEGYIDGNPRRVCTQETCHCYKG